MEKICAYTCITGEYDNLHEIEVIDENVDYICFTNNKSITSETWKIIYIEDENLDNQRLSRKLKMLGHPIISKNYDISVWMDASVVFDKKVSEFVNKYLKDNAFASFKHAYSNCIYKEANECIRLKKDKKEIILKQVDFLKQEKYPEENGLCEMTVFIKRHNDSKVKETMKMWFDMLCQYSKRDQLSFMYCVWKTGLKIDLINLSVWNNEWFHCLKHNYKKELDTCRIYFGDDTNFDPTLDVQPLYEKKGNLYKIKTKVLINTNTIEIELTDIPCIEYKDLEIKGINPTKIEFYNTIKLNGKDIFYSNSGMIKLTGDFKKNEQLKLMITMSRLNELEKYQLIETLSIEKINKAAEIKVLKADKYSLLTENKNLTQEIESILNSKSWKITKPIRYITEKLKKNNRVE